MSTDSFGRISTSIVFVSQILAKKLRICKITPNELCAEFRQHPRLNHFKRKYHIHPRTLKRFLHRNGITFETDRGRKPLETFSTRRSEKYQDVLDFLIQGQLTNKEIGKKTGVHTSYVYSVAMDIFHETGNLVGNHLGRKLEIDRVREYSRSDRTITDISRLSGLSWFRTKRILKKYNLPYIRID